MVRVWDLVASGTPILKKRKKLVTCLMMLKKQGVG